MSRSLVLILLLGAATCLVLLEARSLPDEPHQTFIRRRVSPTDPDLEIIEVIKVYQQRRPPKKVVKLDDDEMDWHIRCDFQPNLKECQRNEIKPVRPGLPTLPPSGRTTTSRSTTRRTTTPEPPMDESLQRRIRCEIDPTLEECAPPTTSSTSTTSSTTTTTTTTTTELPLLPDLSSPEPEEETETDGEVVSPLEDTETDGDADVDSPLEDTETETEPKTDYDTDTSLDTNANTEKDTETDTDTDTDTDTEKDTDTDTDTETDTDTDNRSDIETVNETPTETEEKSAPSPDDYFPLSEDEEEEVEDMNADPEDDYDTNDNGPGIGYNDQSAWRSLSSIGGTGS